MKIIKIKSETLQTKQEPVKLNHFPINFIKNIQLKSAFLCLVFYEIIGVQIGLTRVCFIYIYHSLFFFFFVISWVFVLNFDLSFKVNVNIFLEIIAIYLVYSFEGVRIYSYSYSQNIVMIRGKMAYGENQNKVKFEHN